LAVDDTVFRLIGSGDADGATVHDQCFIQKPCWIVQRYLRHRTPSTAVDEVGIVAAAGWRLSTRNGPPAAQDAEGPFTSVVAFRRPVLPDRMSRKPLLVADC
jgi:hypothetical protein